MIYRLLGFFLDPITAVLTRMVRLVLWSSFLFSTAYSFGWVQNLLWFALETTASKLWNGAPVTIGSVEVDLVRGRLWVTNLVIHTPDRDEWQWDSPLICRIGRIYVEHNFIISFFTMLFQMACGKEQKQILEIYSVEVSDVQGFIERKQHIFNFYLLDPLMDLPDPKEIIEAEKNKSMEGLPQKSQTHPSTNTLDESKNTTNDNVSEISVDLSISEDQVEAAFPVENQTNSSDQIDDEADDVMNEQDDSDMAHRQAQQIVDDMVSAVNSLRKARQNGELDKGSIGRTLAARLKKFQGAKNKSEVMQEGVKVIKRVSHAVAKKTKDIKTVMPKIPKRRERDTPPVFARVGRIIIQDARVFTRTKARPGAGVSKATASRNDSSKPPPNETQNKQQQPGAKSDPTPEQSGGTASQGLTSKWSKSIGISEIVLRPSELCPPSSLLDEDGLPAIYQPIEKIADVVMKRALVNLAKSNTARFLQTALGELLEMEYSSIFGDNTGVPSSPAANSRSYRRSSTAWSEPNPGASNA